MKARERNKPLNENWVKSESHDHKWHAKQLLKKAKEREEKYNGKVEVIQLEKGYATRYVERNKLINIKII